LAPWLRPTSLRVLLPAGQFPRDRKPLLHCLSEGDIEEHVLRQLAPAQEPTLKALAMPVVLTQRDTAARIEALRKKQRQQMLLDKPRFVSRKI
jgi:hypothetical protein